MRRTITTGLSVAALATGITLVTSGAASAEPDWDELAQCESGGNWQSTAGHYEGGIQFDPHTWDAYGGNQYAPSADQATRSEQIAVGRRVLASQGYSAWPGCSAKTGWENGGSPTSHRTASANTRATTHPHQSAYAESARQVRTVAEPVHRITIPADAVPTLTTGPRVAPPGGSIWTVARGDTLTSIAAKLKASGHDVPWQKILDANRDVVEHQDWIFPGERLVIPAA